MSEEREEEEEQAIKPIPDRLITELMAYRTLALRDALAQDPDVAFQAALHALCLKLFYRYTSESCLDIDVKSVVFGSHAPGLDATTSLSSESSEISPDSPVGEESATTGCETAMADSELPEDKFVAA